VKFRWVNSSRKRHKKKKDQPGSQPDSPSHGQSTRTGTPHPAGRRLLSIEEASTRRLLLTLGLSVVSQGLHRRALPRAAGAPPQGARTLALAEGESGQGLLARLVHRRRGLGGAGEGGCSRGERG